MKRQNHQRCRNPAACRQIHSRRRTKLGWVESLESRRLLSTAWALAALPGNPVGRPQAFNDAAMVAGESNSGGGFLFSGGKVTEFQSPGNAPVTVTSMNASGQVVGYISIGSMYSGSEAFLYSAGKITLLGFFGGTWSQAISINNSGVIAGEYQTTAGVFRGFVLSNGKMTDLGTLGGPSTQVAAMNNAGQIAGMSEISPGNRHAFVYSGGKMTDIDPLSGDYSQALAINDAGQILALDRTSPFVYSGGSIHRMQIPGAHLLPAVMSSTGVVAGQVANAKGEYDLFIYANGVTKDVGGIADSNIFPTAINAAGTVGGYSEINAPAGMQGPFVYQNGAIQPLNYNRSLLGSDAAPLAGIDAITSGGKLVADDGLNNVYLLTPVAAGSISGTVFHDVNADGVQQASEKGLSGRLVYDDVLNTGAFDPSDPHATTDSAGHYTLGNLPPGPYTIRFQPPTSNWKQPAVSLTLTAGHNTTGINFATLPLYSYRMTDLGTLGGVAAPSLWAINNVGQIGGEFDLADGSTRPFLYAVASAKLTDLTSALGSHAVITSVNDLGQMVGYIITTGKDAYGRALTKGFVYSGGKLTMLPLPPGTQSLKPVGINNKGQIVAAAETIPDPTDIYQLVYIQGYLYSASNPKFIGGIPQAHSDIGGLAINDNGQIFENCYEPAWKGSPPFGGQYLFTGGKLLQLPLASGILARGPWFGNSIDARLGNSIFPYGPDVVYGPLDETSTPATLYTRLQAVSLVDTLPTNPHWTESAATAINASNVILVQGTNSLGQTRDYVLTPVLASISGKVFKDANGDRIKQSAEPGLAGWTVYADLNRNGKLDAGEPTALTDSLGRYNISGLAAGGFTVRIVPKTGYRQTAPTAWLQTIVAAGQAATGPAFGEVVVGPFTGKPAAFGRIQAENFDLGGQGSGYYNPLNTNNGKLYRPLEGVGIGAIPAAQGGGNFVGWTQRGEWLNYTVTVAVTGTYTLNFRVASGIAGSAFHLNVDGVNVTGTLSIPNKGWETYSTVSKAGVHLTAGTHVLRLVIDSSSNQGNGNFDWFEAMKT